MGARDLRGFRVAGKALHSLGLVKGSEGNLSTFDGRRLRITRTGARLAELGVDDVVEGRLDAPPADASSDLAIHVARYRERGPGAVVHAHPRGSVPSGWSEGQPHGIYTFAATLEEAVAEAVADAREPIGRVTPVEWAGDGVRILDQARLPAEERYVEARSVDEVAAAIRNLSVRGAPVLGIAAAYGLALTARGSSGATRDSLLAEMEAGGRTLRESRPTAVNIGWAVDRVLDRARAAADAAEIREAVLVEAERIRAEDAEACDAIGRLGQEIVSDGANVLTHCNTGMLCTGGIGTALGVIHRAHVEGKGIHVWVGETRPVWQGARLTAWELRRSGVPFTLVADAAAASLMASGKVDLVIVGADRIAANGDLANKIGTYGLAVLARHHGVPFYVAAPTSSVDLSTPSGSSIEVEERDPSEVTAPLGIAVAPPGTPASNPAFDVTPAELVTAIVTEAGIARPPYSDSLAALVREAA